MPIKWPKDDAARKHFSDAVNLSMQSAAVIANAVIGAMYVADIESAKHSDPRGKIPPAKYPNTYQVAKACEASKGMASAVCNGIEQFARKRYTSKNSNGLPYRIAALTGRGSVPTVTRCPYPVRASITWESKARRPHLGRGGEPFIWLPLLTADGNEWFEIELQHK